jgi:hypothetical protein
MFALVNRNSGVGMSYGAVVARHHTVDRCLRTFERRQRHAIRSGKPLGSYLIVTLLPGCARARSALWTVCLPYVGKGCFYVKA